jgi:excisionase family DNA binding protein
MRTENVPPAGSEASFGERLLTAAEVAEILSVPERWIRDASREGRIPSVRLGRYVRFRRESILLWVSAHEAGAGDRR